MHIIDADSHVIESEQTWSYLDPVYRSRRPVPVAVQGDTPFKDWNTFWLIDRKVRHFGATPIEGNTMAERKAYSVGCQQITDVAERVAAMDRMQVARQVVHPSFTLSILTEDPDLEAALIQSYNTFMANACAQSGGRIFFNAVVPFRQPDVAVEEIRRVKEMGGMVSVLARGLEWDRPLDHPSHYPIFEEAQRQGLPIVVHLGLGSPSMYHMFDGLVHPASEQKTFYPPYSRRLLSTLTVQYAFYNLMEGSLIDDFPRLRWAFLEGGGCSWMAAAARTVERGGKQIMNAFADRRVYVGCEPDDDIGHAASVLGEDVLLVSSDMPHFDEAAHDSIAEEYEERGDLTPQLLEKMFMSNAQTLFDFASASRAKASI
ncbi:MAG: amidohydrolase family protein [Pigmentiphaga sp.]